MCHIMKHAFAFIFAQKVMLTKGNTCCYKQPVSQDTRLETTKSPLFPMRHEIKMKAACYG